MIRHPKLGARWRGGGGVTLDAVFWLWLAAAFHPDFGEPVKAHR